MNETLGRQHDVVARSPDHATTGSMAESKQATRESSPLTEDPRVTTALEEYLSALEAGRPPERHEFLARHADIATALVKCLDGLEFIQKAAPRIRESSADSAAATNTGVHAEAPLGDYRILHEIGRGGMGVVYEAVQISRVNGGFAEHTVEPGGSTS